MTAAVTPRERKLHNDQTAKKKSLIFRGQFTIQTTVTDGQCFSCTQELLAVVLIPLSEACRFVPTSSEELAPLTVSGWPVLAVYVAQQHCLAGMGVVIAILSFAPSPPSASERTMVYRVSSLATCTPQRSYRCTRKDQACSCIPAALSGPDLEDLQKLTAT